MQAEQKILLFKHMRRDQEVYKKHTVDSHFFHLNLPLRWTCLPYRLSPPLVQHLPFNPCHLALSPSFIAFYSSVHANPGMVGERRVTHGPTAPEAVSCFFFFFVLFLFPVHFSRPEGSGLAVDCSIKVDLHLISVVLFTGGGVSTQKPAVFI